MTMIDNFPRSGHACALCDAWIADDEVCCTRCEWVRHISDTDLAQMKDLIGAGLEDMTRLYGADEIDCRVCGDRATEFNERGVCCECEVMK